MQVTVGEIVAAMNTAGVRLGQEVVTEANIMDVVALFGATLARAERAERQVSHLKQALYHGSTAGVV